MHLLSGSHSVLVNNRSGLTLGGLSVLLTAAGHVIVTPLISRPSPTPINAPVCSSRSIRLLSVCHSEKEWFQDIHNPDEVSTEYKLEHVIKDQLFDEISWSSFDIGYSETQCP